MTLLLNFVSDGNEHNLRGYRAGRGTGRYFFLLKKYGASTFFENDMTGQRLISKIKKTGMDFLLYRKKGTRVFFHLKMKTRKDFCFGKERPRRDLFLGKKIGQARFLI